MSLYGPFSAPTSGTTVPVRCDIDPYATAIFIRNTSYTDIFVAFRMTPPPVPLFNAAGVLGGRDYYCVIPARSCGGCLIPQGIYDGSGFPGYFYIYYFNRFGAGGSLGNPLPPPLTGQENSFYIETYIDPAQLPAPYGLTNVADALMIPETGNGVMPGGVALGPDANGDNYAAALVIPVQPNMIGAIVGFATGDTTDAATIPAQGANTLCYLTRLSIGLTAYPSAAQALRLTLSGVAVAHQFDFIAPIGTSSPAVPEFIFIMGMLGIPASATNTAITATLTHVGGGTLSAAGAINITGFWRPA